MLAMWDFPLLLEVRLHYFCCSPKTLVFSLFIKAGLNKFTPTLTAAFKVPKLTSVTSTLHCRHHTQRASSAMHAANNYLKNDLST